MFFSKFQKNYFEGHLGTNFQVCPYDIPEFPYTVLIVCIILYPNVTVDSVYDLEVVIIVIIYCVMPIFILYTNCVVVILALVTISSIYTHVIMIEVTLVDLYC